MSFVAPVGSARVASVSAPVPHASHFAPPPRITLEGFETTSPAPVALVAPRRAGETANGLQIRQIGAHSSCIDHGRLRPISSPRSEEKSRLNASVRGIPQSARPSAAATGVRLLPTTRGDRRPARSPDAHNAQVTNPSSAGVQVGMVIKEARVLHRTPTVQQQFTSRGGSLQVPTGCSSAGGSLQMPMYFSKPLLESHSNSRLNIGSPSKRLQARVLSTDAIGIGAFGSATIPSTDAARGGNRQPSSPRVTAKRNDTIGIAGSCTIPLRGAQESKQLGSLSLGNGSSSSSRSISGLGSATLYEAPRKSSIDVRYSSPPSPLATCRTVSVPKQTSPREVALKGRASSEKSLAIQNKQPVRPAKVLPSTVLSRQIRNDSDLRLGPTNRTHQVQQGRAAYLAEKENQLAESVDAFVSRLTSSRKQFQDDQVSAGAVGVASKRVMDNDAASLRLPRTGGSSSSKVYEAVVAPSTATIENGGFSQPSLLVTCGAAKVIGPSQTPNLTPRQSLTERQSSQLTSPAVTPPTASPRLLVGERERSPRNSLAQIMKVPMLDLSFPAGAPNSSQGYVSTRSSSLTPRDASSNVTPGNSSRGMQNSLAPLESMRYNLIVFDFDLTLTTVMLGVETRAFPKPLSEVSATEFGGELRVQLLQKLFAMLLLKGVNFFIVSLGYNDRIRGALAGVGLEKLFPYGSILGRDSDEMQACECQKSGVIAALMRRLQTTKDMTLYIDDSPTNIENCTDLCTVFCPQGNGISVVELQAIVNNYDRAGDIPP